MVWPGTHSHDLTSIALGFCRCKFTLHEDAFLSFLQNQSLAVTPCMVFTNALVLIRTTSTATGLFWLAAGEIVNCKDTLPFDTWATRAARCATPHPIGATSNVRLEHNAKTHRTIN